MAPHSSHFKPGQSGNPNGRPVGAANRRSVELYQRLRDRGDVDPAEFCSSIVSSPTEATELKLQAANYLLPYLYNKRGTITPFRYIEEPVQLPRPATIEQANANIARISEMKALGHIDLDFAESLIADNRTIANNLIAEEELKLKLSAAGGLGETTIRIEGGLPQLPGSNITMPTLNGKEHDLLPPQPPPTLQQNADGEYQPARDQEPTESVTASDSDGSVETEPT